MGEWFRGIGTLGEGFRGYMNLRDSGVKVPWERVFRGYSTLAEGLGVIGTLGEGSRSALVKCFASCAVSTSVRKNKTMASTL